MREETSSQDYAMEEILSSIRQLMEEEAAQEENPTLEEKEDILELTDLLPDENSPSAQGLEKKRGGYREKKDPRLPAWAENIKTPLPPQPSQEKENQLKDNLLLSQSAAHKTAQAFQDLSQAATRSHMENPSIPSPLEAPLRDLLKPLLKEWLDTNLPVLVRWIVNEQVEKLLLESGVGVKKTGKTDK